MPKWLDFRGRELTPYQKFLEQHADLGRDEFLAQIQEPYLLVTVAADRQRSAGFRTVKFTKESLDQAEASGPSLIPVRKRADGNAFGMMITMGRANNNDVVIPDGKVSKFHAYFRQVGSEWRISDANSRNGTYLNGLSVPQDQGMPIVSGSKIKLAKTLELVFYDPPGLFDKLQQDKPDSSE